jgi:hypothetical protein
LARRYEAALAVVFAESDLKFLSPHSSRYMLDACAERLIFDTTPDLAY